MSPGLGIDVHGIARLILDGVAAHFDAAPPERALPSRRVIAPGNPRLIAWDCEQLVVSLAGIGWGVAPGTNSATARPTGNPVSTGGRHAVYAVQLVRCVPESTTGRTPPAAQKVTEAGLGLLADAGLLSQALAELESSNALPKGAGLAGAVEVLGPEGGMAAVEGSLTITVGELI